jgi:hypothetical protein
MGPTRSEMETIFRYAADEATVSIFTAYPPTRRKLARAGYTPSRVSRQHGDEVGWFYVIPLAEFRWRAGARKRILTPTQRAAMAERLSQARPKPA